MRGLARVVGAGALAVSAIVGFGGPAWASEVPQGSVTITPTRDANKVITSTNRPTVSGEVHMSGQGTVQTAVIHVRSLATPASMPELTLNACNSPDPCGRTSVTYSQTLPALAANGPYEVTVVTTGRESPIDIDGDQSRTLGPERVVIELGPAAPENLRAVVSQAPRSVTLSWDRNAEPDLVSYVVARKGPDEAAYRVLRSIAQPAAAGRVSYADVDLGAVGGQFAYRVYAVRSAGDATNNDRAISSEPSSTTARLDGPPPTGPTTTGAPPVPTPAGDLKSGPLPSPVITNTGPLNFSKFTSTGGASGHPAAPDGPFSQTLDYGQTPTTGQEQPEPATRPRAMPAERTSDRRSSSKTLLIPLSGGAALLVGALQLRWLTSRATGPIDLA